MSDPTLALMKRLEDPTDWDDVLYGVPIFTEHEMWEVEDGEDEQGKPKTRRVVVLPGEKAPESATLAYRIGPKELRASASQINRNYEEYGKPVKIFIGHTLKPTDQTQQPPLVGYGIDAEVGPWGPKGRLALKLDEYIERGCGKVARKYPERSPEFYPGKNEITGLALLKTDPRLPMGMVTYKGSDGAILYGRGFDMADQVPDQTDKTPDEVRSDEAYTPEEATQYKRMAGFLEKYHEPFKSMCEKYAESQAATAGPTDGAIPGEQKPDIVPVPEKKPGEDPEKMQLLTRLTKLEEENKRAHFNYARSEATREIEGLVRDGYKIKDKDKEAVRLARLSPEGRAERLVEIRECYQREEETTDYGASFLPTSRSAPDSQGARAPQFTDEDAGEAVRYCEENKLDPGSDRDWDKACKAVVAAKAK